MTASIEVGIERLEHARDLPLPAPASPGSAGLDLRAAVPETLELAPGQRTLVATGLVIALPEGWEAQVRPRSGLALRHGVTVLNSPGTIDSDYRGEVKVILVNLGDKTFEVARGERIAQLVVAPVSGIRWREESGLLGASAVRGEGGFGSTGQR